MKTHDALAGQDALSPKDKAVNLVPAELAGIPQIDYTDARVIGSHVGVCTADATVARKIPKGTKIARNTKPPGPMSAGSVMAPSDTSPAPTWISDALLRRYTCTRSAILPECPAHDGSIAERRTTHGVAGHPARRRRQPGRSTDPERFFVVRVPAMIPRKDWCASLELCFLGILLLHHRAKWTGTSCCQPPDRGHGPGRRTRITSLPSCRHLSGEGTPHGPWRDRKPPTGLRHRASRGRRSRCSDDTRSLEEAPLGMVGQPGGAVRRPRCPHLVGGSCVPRGERPYRRQRDGRHEFGVHRGDGLRLAGCLAPAGYT